MPAVRSNQRDSVRSQLNAYEAMGILRWQPGSAGAWLVTPALGTEMRLTTRECWLWLSGVATGRISVT